MPSPVAAMLGAGTAEKITVENRRYKAMRRQLLRMSVGWVEVHREAERLVDSCQHEADCPAPGDPTRPCQCACRETWMSALVILGNAVQFALLRTRLPRTLDEYRAPTSREAFDQLVADIEMAKEAPDFIAELRDLLEREPGDAASDAEQEAVGPVIHGRPLIGLKPAEEGSPAPEPKEPVP